MQTQLSATTRQPVGATTTAAGVTYRVWAPAAQEPQVIVQPPDGPERRLPLRRDDEEPDVFAALDPAGRAGDRYWYELRNHERRPDVASRFQPEGVHGPSEVIDPSSFSWKNRSWKRPAPRDLVIYELHIGTFSPEGTFRAAIERLAHVAALGATAVEVMPVADFPGRFGWGYDGVALFAPSRAYGRPDDFRAFVDAAHGHGLAVILDVVYNHAGPEGSYLTDYSPDYFHRERQNTWGTGFNFDGEKSPHVRAFFLQNAAHWLDEYRVDGLRVDATHAIVDESEPHLLTEIAAVAHARGAFVIAEDERNPVALLHDAEGRGSRFDAVWSDDFHHCVRVALTRIREAYFGSYDGSPAELARTLRRGWTYCGEPFPYWQGRPRGGDCLHLSPAHFVFCIDNHDQSGNRAHGERLAHLVSPEACRAASALLCLSPYTPMLFMGQEWRARTPFLFFSDLSGEDGRLMRARRIEEFRKTGMNRDEARLATMPDPQAPATFSASKLDWSEPAAPPHASMLSLYQECLRWRRARLRGQATERAFWKVFELRESVALRFTPPGEPEWLLVVGLRGGFTIAFSDALTPPAEGAWIVKLHTFETRFGGSGEIDGASRHYRGDTLTLPGAAAIVFQASHAT